MTLEKLEESYKTMLLESSIGLEDILSGIMGYFILPAFIISVTIYFILKTQLSKDIEDEGKLKQVMSTHMWVVNILLGCIIALFSVIYISEVSATSREKGVTEWENTSVKKYMSNLPVQQYRVSGVKMLEDVNSLEDTHKPLPYDKKDTSRLNILYTTADGKTKETTGEVRVIIDKKLKDIMFVKYIKLEEDLPHGLDKGKYGVELIIPEGYVLN